jgi:hypothetical protein
VTIITMSTEALEDYVRELGYEVSLDRDPSGTFYTVIHGLVIQRGSLRGQTCDVAIVRPTSIPYTVASAIHTRPALVPMDMAGPLKTQASPLGNDWQYWSRRFDHAPTPPQIWVHILTVLGQV